MNTPVFIPLSHLSVLDISGPDASSFLQSQIPADVRLLTPTQARISGWCTAKGRLLTTFVLWPVADGYRLILARDVADAVAKRLKLFVLRLKVQITRRDDQVAGLLQPPAALADFPLPTEPWQVTTQAGLTAIRLDSGRLLLTGDAAAFATAEAAIHTQTTPAPLDAWLRADIAQGFPLVTQATSEHYVPQMVHLDKLGGVSFKKGCYPGQEIVARTHYLGKIKRHLYRLQANQPLSVGSDVRAAQLNGQACGSLLCVAPAADGQHWLALAVLQEDALNGDLYCAQQDTQQPLTVLDAVQPAAD